jgi:hypothetical protein
MSTPIPIFVTERNKFHQLLLSSLLTINTNNVASNADGKNPTSVRIALDIANQLKANTGVRVAAQTSGSDFESAIESFIRSTFLQLGHLRPGTWDVLKISARSRGGIAQFAQYSHLRDLESAARGNNALLAALGNGYVIRPDIVVTRELEDDNKINSQGFLIDGAVSNRADLRSGVDKPKILHASISSKWTLRSDRAQNARSEALNLIRNRKGRQPHIAVVTAEPLPSRLASIALGTGDIDCVYHFALDELINSISGLGNTEASDMLTIMIDGKRLKDISDLPLDLAV